MSREVTFPSGRTYPAVQLYISRPGIFEDPLISQDHWRVGGKVTYFDATGRQEQFGQLIRVTKLEHKLLERCILILGEGLADGILQHEKEKVEAVTLPTRELTPEIRARLVLPF